MAETRYGYPWKGMVSDGGDSISKTSGKVDSSFPTPGTPQPAHMGSQSYSPSKDESDPTPNMKSFGNNKVID